MLVAKLKGIALAVGTLTAVVSGAVVLAQQSGPKGPGNLEHQSPNVETKVYRTEPADRTAELEKKLDRVLEALERLSHPAPVPTVTPGPAVAAPNSGPALGGVPAPGGIPGPTAELAPVTAEHLTGIISTAPAPAADQGTPAPPPSVAAPPKAPLSNRLENLENQMRFVTQRLDRLEKRLKALDARVGGAEVESSVSTTTAEGRMTN